MVASRPRSHVNEMGGSLKDHLVPCPLWHDERLTRPERDRAVSAGFFEDEVDPSCHHIEEFVPVGMQLAVVGSISGHLRRADGIAVDSRRRTGFRCDDGRYAVAVEGNDRL